MRAITDIADLADILLLLDGLTNSQFTRLGLQLGLLVSTLDKFTADDYGIRVLEAWLNQTDKVMDRGGVPTWNSLIGALLTPTVQGKVQAQRIQHWLVHGIKFVLA